MFNYKLKIFSKTPLNPQSMNYIKIYNDSLSKMQKILEEQLLRNIDQDQVLNQLSTQNSMLKEEIDKLNYQLTNGVAV